ncbi:MAG TPA: hypothetical protein VK911_09245, partial [Vicinamibacterales bacterium]|nr:hypothetical protein [Vicinamibacterales bacterium]
GLLVPPASPDALAQALVRLARSREERIRLGTAARAAAAAYHQSHLLKAVSDLYREGLRAKRRASP